MTSRELIVEVIREVVRGQPIADVKTYADALPTNVRKGADKFCDEQHLGGWFRLQIVGRNISVARELYEFIASTQPKVKETSVQSKGVVAPGENNRVN
ncbi:hypothetical protein ACFZAD_24480 [Streptomyces iakyrus]|uniref:hypothetical protein n=1 Tax=Streptomyces iakyrus TaxID=68219 RepID=UPI0036E3F980